MPRYYAGYNKKNKKKNFWSAVFLAFLLYIMVSFGFEVYKLYIMHREVKALSAEVYELKADNEKLLEDIKRLKNNSHFETRAREMGFVKPGEKVIVIEKKGNKDASSD
ncbi:FtsB family cell division protein [Carboxydothermus hydrogenoformans]|uniref:Septum formation initiator family protein n=1 Tax=Carboxydothermus hydrogenoformans (strain ATCC BAA-161 / DSM 6008 / Z-2901) TaxID=246194 RepID=Q3AFK2_CARHZ|nr:septum formation initiator family protein [Carboxydothermus hydrogenoformans]ABB14743.1 conserved hypothetical protein [Carboxydothermus hydrogenoformans Z-2901]